MEDRLTADDRIGMFEAGLEELTAAGFAFAAENVPGGVRLTIVGLQRTDASDGTWHLDPLTNGRGEPSD